MSPPTSMPTKTAAEMTAFSCRMRGAGQVRGSAGGGSGERAAVLSWVVLQAGLIGDFEGQDGENVPDAHELRRLSRHPEAAHPHGPVVPPSRLDDAISLEPRVYRVRLAVCPAVSVR